MVADGNRAPADDPQDLERMLVSRKHARDLDGMVALCEPDAVLDVGNGRHVRGRQAIAELFADGIADGRQFAVGVQRPAVVSGDFALTSTRLPDGTVTSEVARRHPDGTYLWVIDRFSVE